MLDLAALNVDAAVRRAIVLTNESKDSGVTGIGQARLRASAYRGVRILQCECHEKVLVLRGRVSSYYET
jgi:hypothetical protein